MSPVFATKRRAEEFHDLVEQLDRGAGSSLRRRPRPRRAAARDRAAGAARGVHRLVARGADGRRREPAPPLPRHPAPDAAPAPLRPRPAARRVRRRHRRRRRHQLAGRGLPVRPARRDALPPQAGPRECQHRCPPQRRGAGRVLALPRHRPARRGLGPDPHRRPRRRPGDRADPRLLQRPVAAGLRPAARRLRRERRREGRPGAARLHLHQHGHPRPARDAAAGGGP